MSGIICNLKAFSKDIYEGQQVLTHADHLKTFTKIQSHLKIKEECIKMFGTPNVAHVAKGNRPKGNNKNNRGKPA